VGFAPLAAPDARILVLGTLPGPQSLQAHQYYAHPRNAFWPIFAALLAPFLDDYAARVRALTNAGVAVWDVLAEAPREGALDSRIQRTRAKPNDFEAFFSAHPQVRVVLFNGAEAARLYHRFVMPALPPARQGLALEVLPSTSPTRTLPLKDKLAAWEAALKPYL
jgi:hypoxanthine-DNA glycosylase